ncbi:MAG TPA: hypothetical protein VIL49_05240, partial [Capillimicrobium sp.]
MSNRKLGLACVAACAVVAAGPASAMGAGSIRQNTANTNKAIEELKGQLTQLGTEVGEIKTKTDAFAFIAAAAPQIVDGLTQLKNGLETLAGAYQAVEYGVAQVNVYGGGAIVNPPSWSPDIPDDGNGASIGATALYPNFQTGGPVTKTFTVNAYVRSNENDANGANGPVAQGGAMMSVTATNAATGATSFLLCQGDATTGGVGGITPSGEPINTPDGAIKNQPLTNILTGKSRTDQTLPGADAPQLATCTVQVPPGTLIGPSTV